MAYTSAA
jgi:hypothetical protein